VDPVHWVSGEMEASDQWQQEEVGEAERVMQEVFLRERELGYLGCLIPILTQLSGLANLDLGVPCDWEKRKKGNTETLIRVKRETMGKGAKKFSGQQPPEGAEIATVVLARTLVSKYFLKREEANGF